MNTPKITVFFWGFDKVEIDLLNRLYSMKCAFWYLSVFLLVFFLIPLLQVERFDIHYKHRVQIHTPYTIEILIHTDFTWIKASRILSANCFTRTCVWWIAQHIMRPIKSRKYVWFSSRKETPCKKKKNN